MNISRTLGVAIVAFGTLLPLSPATSAELNPGMNTRAVTLTGLDLNNPKHVPVVYTRLRVAAQSVCKNLHTLELGLRHAKWERCVQGALSRAIADINSPALTAYSQGKPKPALVARDVIPARGCRRATASATPSCAGAK